MNRKHNVLKYIDDALFVLSIWPEFPEHRRGEIPGIAALLRLYYKSYVGILSLGRIGFRFEIEQEPQHGLSPMWDIDDTHGHLLHLSDMRRH